MDVTNSTTDQYRNVLDYLLTNSYQPKDYWDVKNNILKNEELFTKKK